MSRVIRFVGGVVIVLLALRLVLAWIGSNVSSGFAHFIVSVTNPMVAPFTGLVHYSPTTSLSGSQVLTVIAIVVYLIVAWLLVKLVTLGRATSY